MTRTYTEHTYDHVARYPFYQHTTSKGQGFFDPETIRTPYSHQFIGFKHPGLFTGVKNNLNERAAGITPIRNSMLNELHQVKLNIEVAGRTDVEIGAMIYLVYPLAGEKTDRDAVKGNEDPRYSGLYIISAIHHCITAENHFMTMEIIKDSFGETNA